MKLRALKGRSVGELRERLAQALTARAERAGLVSLAEPGLAGLRDAVRPALRDAYTSAAHWGQGLMPGTFFPAFDDAEGTVRAAVSADPTFSGWCLDQAERACQGRFDLLGYRDLAWGLPVDWHREPRAGVQAPMAHWSAIRYLDRAVVGDHKLVWELNRHQWLVTLAQAARLTGDPKWSTACVQFLNTWMDANPPGRGVNWASSLEIAFRVIAWIWTVRILPQPLPPDTAVRLAGHLLRSGRHLERYLSTYFSPNTHLTGEALGLLYLGTQMSQFEAADRWRETGWRILTQQAVRHIQDDGVYFEHTSWYHRYTVDFYVHALLLARRNNIAVPSELPRRLELAMDHLMTISRPEGSLPLIGDDDGGKLIRLDGDNASNSRSALAQGAVLFGRGDLARAAQGAGAEVVWLLGAAGKEALERLNAAEPTWRSRAFDSSGYFAMRDSWGPDASLMVIDCGRHGVMNCGHAHADALAFDLTVRGVPILVDPGTGSYTTSVEERNHFRSTGAHNVVTVDGRSSSTEAGPFQWDSIAMARVEGWAATSVADYFQGSHNGYHVLPDPVTVRRAVLFVHGRYWVVRDEVEANGEHEIMVSFQAAEGTTIEAGPAGGVVCHRDGAPVVAIFGVTSPENSTVAVEAGRVAPMYGRVVESPLLRYRAQTRGPAVFVTLLVPGNGAGLRVRDLGQGVLEVDGPFGRDLVRLGRQGPWEQQGVAGDVAAAWIPLGSNPTRTGFACGGTSLNVAGATHDITPLQIGAPISGLVS